jgi:very-short-patch-repair endonuclease
MLQQYNELLENYSLKIDIWDSEKLCFNNGVQLNTPVEINTFKRRIEHGVLINFIDSLYSTDKQEREKTEQLIITLTAKKGGIACQQQHGDKIKLNLNTGVPWHTGTVGVVTAWNKGLTKETNESVKKISESKIGDRNPMFGTVYSEEEREQKSECMKELIADGKFTPNIHNSNTHMTTVYKGQKYRSSWEAAFVHINEGCDYETLRIKYELDGKTKVYIVDFINHDTKMVYEIKPKIHQTRIKEKIKETALLNWCLTNGYCYSVIDEDWIYDNWYNFRLNELELETVKKLEKCYEACKKKRNRKAK